MLDMARVLLNLFLDPNLVHIESATEATLQHQNAITILK